MKKGTLVGLFVLSDVIAVALFAFALFQQGEEGNLFSNPLVLTALGLFILVPIVLLVIYSQSSSGSNADLLRTGLPAQATVLAVQEMRPGSKDRPGWVKLKVQVNPPNDSFYEATTTAVVSALNPISYYPGMSLRVCYDPKHPRRVIVDAGSASSMPGTFTGDPGNSSSTFSTQVSIHLPDGSPDQGGQPRLQDIFTGQPSIQVNLPGMANLPPAIQKMIQTALVDADHNGIPDIAEKDGLSSANVQLIDLSGRSGRPVDPQERIEKLEKLRAAGIISQEQFDLLRNLIEKKAQGGSGS
jgi:hypothetical protein